MPEYDSKAFRPPAPVALVVVRSPGNGRTAVDVPLLIDSGADVSCLPQVAIAALLEPGNQNKRYEVEAFDGTKSLAAVAQLEIELLGKSFRGQFLLVNGVHGFLGRNILNNVSLLLDGPSLQWAEHHS